MLKSHTLVPERDFDQIRYELRPALDSTGGEAEGLFNAWIYLDNPAQYNSYTTEAVKEVILAFRQASMDRRVVCCVFTATGDKAFCTGGNTKEYAEYYAGNPQEYKQYMRLFNDMIDVILRNDKPVVNRVNGMRIAGGQEIGMACFSRAMESGTLCETWSAHKALYLGLINQIEPVLKLDGEWIPNPLVVTDRLLDEFGRVVLGDFKRGAERDAGKEILARAEVDLSRLDRAVEGLCTKMLLLMPDCLSKTVNGLRKHKQWHWDNTNVTNREWLALNMMTEARAGFRAFNEGPKGRREVDFVRLRQLLAQGHPWDDELLREISPQYRTES
jgi:6-oxo-cyclohex-1-ene-carbonyl-CoA hydrolase